MTDTEPRPLTRNNHPACIQVLDEIVDQIDLVGAFRHATSTLQPENPEYRGILWIPKPDPQRDAEIAMHAAAGNTAYFQDVANFHRPEIFAELRRPNYVCLIDPTRETSDFVTRHSTSKEDISGEIAEPPHIDAPPIGTSPTPHLIRALHYIHADHPQSSGSVVYEGIVYEHDIDEAGVILRPDPLLGRKGTDKLGQAWQNTNRGAILFMNVGGPVECQLAHNARRTPTNPDDPVCRITRWLDRIDYSTT